MCVSRGKYLVVIGLSLLLGAFGNTFAAAPDWWGANVLTPSAGANDFAAVNQGQVKNLALQASKAMIGNMDGGAGATIDTLVAAFASGTNNYAALNLGQLKSVAKPFYDRLSLAYPWTSSPQPDFAMVNLGQAKTAFSFPIPGPIRPGFDTTPMERNDDGYTHTGPNEDHFENGYALNSEQSPVRIPIGFPVRLFSAETEDEVFINTNGNITFDDELSTFTPKPLRSFDQRIIAPFWADVDTRNLSSFVVTYGTGTVNGSPAFGVNWVNVGYFNTRSGYDDDQSVFHDQLSRFQLVLTSVNAANGDFDMEFNYSKVRWETGAASEGINGFKGFPVRVGIGSGTGSDDIEIADSGVSGAFLDYVLDPNTSTLTSTPNTATGLIYHSRGSTTPGRYIFQVRGGVVVGIPTVNAGSDQTVSQDAITLSGTVNANGVAGLSYQWSQREGPAASIANPSMLTTDVTLDGAGDYTFDLTATDGHIQATDSIIIHRE